MVSPPSADLLMRLVQDSVILGWERLSSPGLFPNLESRCWISSQTRQGFPTVELFSFLNLRPSLASSPLSSFQNLRKVPVPGRRRSPWCDVIQAESVTQLEDGLVCLHLSSGYGKCLPGFQGSSERRKSEKDYCEGLTQSQYWANRLEQSVTAFKPRGGWS